MLHSFLRFPIVVLMVAAVMTMAPMALILIIASVAIISMITATPMNTVSFMKITGILVFVFSLLL